MTTVPVPAPSRLRWWHAAAIWVAVFAFAGLMGRLKDNAAAEAEPSAVATPAPELEAAQVQAVRAVRSHPAVHASARLKAGYAMRLGAEGRILAFVFATPPMSESSLTFCVYLKPLTASPTGGFEVQRILGGRNDHRTQEFVEDPQYRWPR